MLELPKMGSWCFQCITCGWSCWQPNTLADILIPFTKSCHHLLSQSRVPLLHIYCIESLYCTPPYCTLYLSDILILSIDEHLHVLKYERFCQCIWNAEVRAPSTTLSFLWTGPCRRNLPCFPALEQGQGSGLVQAMQSYAAFCTNEEEQLL